MFSLCECGDVVIIVQKIGDLHMMHNSRTQLDVLQRMDVGATHVERMYFSQDSYLSARHSTASMSWSLRMSSTYVLINASIDPSGMWSAASVGLP